jgi:hypothetical protein
MKLAQRGQTPSMTMASMGPVRLDSDLMRQPD